MLWITQAALTGDYQMRVEFNDGARGTVDFWPLIAGDHRAIVRQLADRQMFATAKVELDTVVWDNGVAFAPEFLREHLTTDAFAHRTADALAWA